MKGKFLLELEVIYDAGSRIARSLALMNKPDASEELRREISAHALLTKAQLAKVRLMRDSLDQEGHATDDALSSSAAWLGALIREGNLDVPPANATKDWSTSANLLEIIVCEDNIDRKLVCAS